MPAPGFAELGLPPVLLSALAAVGYEQPSPIQSSTIPHLLAGRDVLGQAQTGTGKTAAFALPILARIDVQARLPQALVLAPTRELAIQVAEAFQRYAHGQRDFHVLPIYGGQGYGPQLAALRRGVQVVVGTPGRIIDHLGRGSLDLSALRCLVLDEADEMLRMGFIDDVEKIMEATPAERQVALFSATMPAPIRRIAQRHLRDPVSVSTIPAHSATASGIRQTAWMVGGLHKLDALTRLLETADFDGMIVFARTKIGTEELAEKLSARGFAAAALNGDVQQAQRERTVNRFKSGDLDILVATDVAARGLDVERVSHVVNFDIPTDPESYVHRIGRTGRAGRSGEAVLFVTARERHLLRAIERATGKRIEIQQPPSAAVVNDQRIARFYQRIGEVIDGGELEPFQSLLARYVHEREVRTLDVAAALARLAQGGEPLLLADDPPPPPPPSRVPPGRARDGVPSRAPAGADAERPPRAPRQSDAGAAEVALAAYRIEVGRRHGVAPGNIVGAIANEAGLDRRQIGRVWIEEGYSLVELPAQLPPQLLTHLAGVWVSGRQLRIRPAPAAMPARPGPAGRSGQRGSEDGGSGYRAASGKPPRKPPRKPTAAPAGTRPPRFGKPPRDR